MYIKKILLAISILIAIGMAIFSYFIYETIFSPNTAFSESSKAVYIETGSDYEEVIVQLRPFLKDLRAFDIVAQKKNYPLSVIPGKFILENGMNNNEIVNTLRSKNMPITVIFNNQERLENLAGRIGEQIEADSLDLLRAMKDTVFLKEHGFSLATALSMYIPNQYEFYWNTSAKEFRKRMWQEYNRFWTESRLQKAEKIGLSPEEVITLAAIVQKETAKVDERKRVAGVYMNRIESSWPLQADPTVIYAIKNKRQNFDTIIKRVLYKDLTIESPYNTYLKTGLPPGPITMPDISAIDAVLNYEKHDFYYFVADVDNFGYHKFSKTLKQHNRNKNEYVAWLKQHKILR
ncbi:MAG TPA: endolytic transglycosylase MltG [Flavobacteriaceae bacterium]|nr:endolytic transglycosylase MltG [Flavobacteriaceae bacterium]